MTQNTIPVAAEGVSVSKKKTNYPEPFSSLVCGRDKRKLGDFFGLSNFGVNLTTLAPGSASALFHAHSIQDEFVYVLEGNPTLIIGAEEHELKPDHCVGFRAGSELAHHLVNRSESIVKFLEIGDRSSGDAVRYPDDDLQAVMNEHGKWIFKHKDGTPY